MRYFDTSFLVPIFVSERYTARVEKVLSREPIGEPTVSGWVRLEFSSALALQVRLATLDRRTAGDIEADFDAMIASTFTMVPVTSADFVQAQQFVRRPETGLRSGDALHLAIASNHRAEAIYSLDRGLLRAGRLLGLPVSDGSQSR
jgi:predicted nucleic acid-binding protein